MVKKIVIITEAAAVGAFYKQLLYELFDSTIVITNISLELDKIEEFPDGDLYFVGATSSNNFGHIISLIRPDKKIVVVYLTFKKSQIEPLRSIPRGTRAMLVNLSSNMAIASIAELNRLGITQIDFAPVYPGRCEIPNAALAITPGEAHFVPPRVEKIIDLGHRVFTSETITEVALKLGFPWFLKSEKYHTYIDSLVESGESVAMLWKESMRSENYLDILMGALDIGILGVDTENVVFAVNSIAQDITRVSRENLIGKSAVDVIPEIGSILDQQKKREKFSLLIKLNDVYISASTAPVAWQGELVGCFVLLQRFTEEEKRQHLFRLQLYQRGHQSKYTFDDIIGQCTAMTRTKTIARKMAQTDSSILLTGESGTGKELFAHSIHNASARTDMPFVAINCAALPESLLESELFGYAEGAFTGAKKGGKLGLFEYAHKGTLFLDEIEGMSPNLQVKLLRVLQEKEMMRVGDDRIISVDARIIAASNENIFDLVRKGKFRKDLYYRLNTLPINIPPLREREGDLFLIMQTIQKNIGASFELSHDAQVVFSRYLWDGNVRELSNIVEYLRFADKHLIEVADLPENMTSHMGEESIYNDAVEEESQKFSKAVYGREEAFLLIMTVLAKAEGGVGRGYIRRIAGERGVIISEQEVRGVLTVLHEMGLVSVSRGRGGSRLTQRGRHILEEKIKH